MGTNRNKKVLPSSSELHTEEDLKEYQAKFKVLFENVCSGIAIYEALNDGEDFVFVDFNPAAEQIENIKKEELIGKCVTEIFPGVKEFGLFDVFQRVYKTGTPAVVVHDDPAAANIDTWTEWIIPLQAFADQGIVLTDVDKVAIGLGTQGNMTIPGGSGKMYIDDIQLSLPIEAAE
jgi:PAS domain-containing protein